MNLLYENVVCTLDFLYLVLVAWWGIRGGKFEKPHDFLELVWLNSNGVNQRFRLLSTLFILLHKAS